MAVVQYTFTHTTTQLTTLVGSFIVVLGFSIPLCGLLYINIPLVGRLSGIRTQSGQTKINDKLTA